MYIHSKSIRAFFRHYGEREFWIIKTWVNEKGVQLYELEFEFETIKTVYIQYNHEDKELFSRVIEI